MSDLIRLENVALEAAKAGEVLPHQQAALQNLDNGLAAAAQNSSAFAGVMELFAQQYRTAPVPAPEPEKPGEIYLLMKRTSQPGSDGLAGFTLSLMNGSRAVDSVTVNSGLSNLLQAGAQTLVHPSKDFSGSNKPLPEGFYDLGAVEIAPNGSWGAGIGRIWVELPVWSDYRLNNRSAFGIHLDENYGSASGLRSPGSAGCIVSKSLATIQRIVDWLNAKNRPQYLVVDYGFGVVRGKYPESMSPKVEKPPAKTIVASQVSVDLISHFEGCPLTAYWDDLGGVWTIGYGTTHGVKQGMTITRAQAEQMLLGELNQIALEIGGSLQGRSQAQIDACLSLAYNIGNSAFLGSSVSKYIATGEFQKAADSFLAWNKSGEPLKPVAGLSRRRCAERALFMSRKWEDYTLAGWENLVLADYKGDRQRAGLD